MKKNGSTLNKLQQKVFLLFSLPEHILYHKSPKESSGGKVVKISGA